MTKTEMKKAVDNEIIFRYIKAYSSFTLNLNLGGKTKSLEKGTCRFRRRNVESRDFKRRTGREFE